MLTLTRNAIWHCRAVGVVFLFTALQTAQADVPTPEQDCVNRRSATCARNGVPYQVDADCPDGTTVLKPFEQVDCSMAAVRARLATRPARNEPEQNGAWVARGQQLLTLVPTLLALLFLVLFVRKQRGHNAQTSLGRSLVVGAVGLAAGGAAAVLAFSQVLRRFDNSDSAGPSLIAMAAATAAFVCVTPLASWAAGRLLER